MAATPQAERRAARVPISSARRRQSSSSGRVAVRESLLAKRSAVSERFSKGSLRGGVSWRFQTGVFLGGRRGREWEEGEEGVGRKGEEKKGKDQVEWLGLLLNCG